MEPTSLVIEGEANGNASAFSTDVNNISNRDKTVSFTEWNDMAPWDVLSQRHRTPDLSAVVQEIICRGDWLRGNSMVFIISGTGCRVAKSYSGDVNTATSLHMEYTMVADDEPPAAAQNLTGNAVSDSRIDLAWDSAVDNVGIAGYEIYRDGAAVGTTVSPDYSDTGLTPLTDYAYSVCAFDHAGNYSDESVSVSVTTLEQSLSQIIEVRVNAANDDAEETIPGGTVVLSSSDLELVDEGPWNNQLIGIRFNGIEIPQGAVILNAYIEFQTDETSNGAASVSISCEAGGTPSGFSANVNNISNRPVTDAWVDWNDIPAWSVVGEKHQTPDISVLVQEITGRSDWSRGSSMVFLFTGNGTRTAESFNGSPSGAPLLHIEYQN